MEFMDYLGRQFLAEQDVCTAEAFWVGCGQMPGEGRLGWVSDLGMTAWALPRRRWEEEGP